MTLDLATWSVCRCRLEMAVAAPSVRPPFFASQEVSASKDANFMGCGGYTWYFELTERRVARVALGV